MNRHLLLLAFCQGMFLTNTVTFIAVNGLAGLALAPVGWMATLPVTTYVIGGALSAPPVAKLPAQWGRRAGGKSKPGQHCWRVKTCRWAAGWANQTAGPHPHERTPGTAATDRVRMGGSCVKPSFPAFSIA